MEDRAEMGAAEEPVHAEERKLLRPAVDDSGAATPRSSGLAGIDLDRRALRPLPIQHSPQRRTAHPAAWWRACFPPIPTSAASWTATSRWVFIGWTLTRQPTRGTLRAGAS